MRLVCGFLLAGTGGASGGPRLHAFRRDRSAPNVPSFADKYAAPASLLCGTGRRNETAKKQLSSFRRAKMLWPDTPRPAGLDGQNCETTRFPEIRFSEACFARNPDRDSLYRKPWFPGTLKPPRHNMRRGGFVCISLPCASRGKPPRSARACIPSPPPARSRRFRQRPRSRARRPRRGSARPRRCGTSPRPP